METSEHRSARSRGHITFPRSAKRQHKVEAIGAKTLSAACRQYGYRISSAALRSNIGSQHPPRFEANGPEGVRFDCEGIGQVGHTVQKPMILLHPASIGT